MLSLAMPFALSDCLTQIMFSGAAFIPVGTLVMVRWRDSVELNWQTEGDVLLFVIHNGILPCIYCAITALFGLRCIRRIRCGVSSHSYYAIFRVCLCCQPS